MRTNENNTSTVRLVAASLLLAGGVMFHSEANARHDSVQQVYAEDASTNEGKCSGDKKEPGKKEEGKCGSGKCGGGK